MSRFIAILMALLIGFGVASATSKHEFTINLTHYIAALPMEAKLTLAEEVKTRNMGPATEAAISAGINGNSTTPVLISQAELRAWLQFAWQVLIDLIRHFL